MVQRQSLHGVQDEMDDMLGGNPSRRSQGRNIGVWRSTVTKRAGMILGTVPPPGVCSKNLQKSFSP